MASPTVRSRADNLPVELTSFIGRRRELAELRQALGSSRLVTLTGPGGVGKTRLATHAAADLAARYRDGISLVDLSSVRDPLLVTEAVVEALAVQGEAARWSVSTLTDYLAGKRLLLILDNCEHVLDAAALLAGTLLRACPELRILATSRQALGVAGELVQSVAAMSLPEATDDVVAALRSDAVALFLERAGGQRGEPLDGRSLAAVVALCRGLDGIPLALELAAVRARSLGLEVLAGGLGDHLFALASRDRSASPRQQTLESTIDWSYQLLTPGERLLWQRLSVFAGGFEMDAAEQVCADEVMPAASIPVLLASLGDKSLVTRDERTGRPRFRILEVLRQFARDRLEKSGAESAIRGRHAAWVSALSAELWANDDRQVDLFQRIRADRANVWAALDQCIQQPGAAAHGIWICRNLWAFWQSERPVSEILRVLDLLGAFVPADSREHATTLWVAAFLKAIQRDPASAADLATRAVAIGRALRDAETVAWSLAALGDAAWYDGRWADFERAATDAFALAEIIGLPMVAVVAGYLAAGALVSAGDLEGGLLLGEDAVRRSEQLGETWVRAYALSLIANVLTRQGRLDEAERIGRRCIGLRRALGDGVGVRLTLEVLAGIEAARGAHQRAAALIGADHGVWRAIAGAAARPAEPESDQVRQAVRDELDDTRFEAAYAAGLALTPDEAIDFALSDLALPATASSASTARRESGPLSRRELEVARLIADGASNGQTASRLFISERTVESHVSSIFNKLGFDSRVQLARWVANREAGEA